MPQRTAATLPVTLMLVCACMLLQGFLPFFNRLDDQAAMRAADRGLEAGGTILRVYGITDPAASLEPSKHVVQVPSGDSPEGVPLTVERTRTVYGGDSPTSHGELNDQGALFDAVQRAVGLASEVSDELGRNTDRFENRDNLETIQRSVRILGSSDYQGGAADHGREPGGDREPDTTGLDRSLGERFRDWTRGRANTGDPQEVPPLLSK